MYHSTEEIINEVRARMIAGTTKHSTLPPEIREDIRSYVDSKTPEELRAALSKAWRFAHGRE